MNIMKRLGLMAVWVGSVILMHTVFHTDIGLLHSTVIVVGVIAFWEALR